MCIRDRRHAAQSPIHRLIQHMLAIKIGTRTGGPGAWKIRRHKWIKSPPFGTSICRRLSLFRSLSAHRCAAYRPLCPRTASGSSRNILRAIEAAPTKRVAVIGLTGESGGQMRTSCDLCLCVPSKSTARIQEMHVIIGHAICQLLEEALTQE